MQPENQGRPNSPEGVFASSDALYRVLVEQVPCIVYVDSHEVQPRSLYVSPQVEAILGHPPADYLADPRMWQKTIHPDDSERVAASWARTVATGEPFELEYRMVRPDGTVVWVRDGSVPVRGNDGTPIFWQGVMLDITAPKRAEEELRESETRYRALVENVPAVVYMVAPDDDRKTLYVSPEVERALGYARGEWLGQPDIWMELLHPDDREETLAAHDTHNETGAPWDREYRLIASDGREVWFRDVATLVRDQEGWPLYWQGIQLDITERRRAEDDLRAAHDELELRVIERTFELEEANEMLTLEVGERKRVEEDLRTTEARYRMLVEQMPAVTYLWDVGSRTSGEPAVYVSPQIERMLGFTPAEWTADPNFWVRRVHPDDLDAVLAGVRRSEVTGETFRMEYRHLAKDGHVVWVDDEASLISRDEEGRPGLFHGMMLDITERKEAEAKAAANEAHTRAAEERYRELVERIPAIVFVGEVDRLEPGGTRITYMSPQSATILGLAPEESMVGDQLERAIHPDDRGRVMAEWGRSAETGRPLNTELRVIAKDGRAVWLHFEAVLERDPTGRPRHWHGVALDITERKLAESLIDLREEAEPALRGAEAPSAGSA